MRALSSWEFLEHERQSCRQEHDTLTAHRQLLVQPTGAVHERARESVGGDDALTDLVTDKHLIAREVHQAVEERVLLWLELCAVWGQEQIRQPQCQAFDDDDPARARRCAKRIAQAMRARISSSSAVAVAITVTGPP